jgi:hypothetical protein
VISTTDDKVTEMTKNAWMMTVGRLTAGMLKLAAIAACGNDEHLRLAADAAPDAWSPAAHEAQPVAMSFGGPVLAAPEIVPIFFSGDDTAQAQLETFMNEVATSTYWPTVVGEYGVGALTVDASIVSTDTPPTTDMALQTWLTANTNGTVAGWPTPTPNTIYAVFLPAGVTLTASFGASCVAFGGYHSETTGGALVYALLPRCASSSTNPLDPVTAAASHEFVEASTDPHFYTKPAYRNIDTNHLVWGDAPGAELGDMCEYVDAAFQRLIGDFLVQRTWSNASAAAGHDPCVPLLDQPYTGAAPVLAPVTVTPKHGSAYTTLGVTVDYGTPLTVEVQLFSDSETAGEFIVEAEDAASATGGGTAAFDFQWDNQYGQNGDKRHVIITRTAPGGSVPDDEFVIFAFQNNVKVAEWWAFVAGM